MANLFAITIVRQDRRLLNPTTAAYINPRFVYRANAGTYRDASGNLDSGTDIDYKLYDKSYDRQFTTVEPVSAISSRMNAANTTNSVYRVPITVINPDLTTYADSINVDDIVYIQNHPTDNTDCLLLLNTPMLDVVKNLRIDGTAATLAALANA